jgi:hypothetical protein
VRSRTLSIARPGVPIVSAVVAKHTNANIVARTLSEICGVIFVIARAIVQQADAAGYIVTEAHAHSLREGLKASRRTVAGRMPAAGEVPVLARCVAQRARAQCAAEPLAKLRGDKDVVADIVA